MKTNKIGLTNYAQLSYGPASTCSARLSLQLLAAYDVACTALNLRVIYIPMGLARIRKPTL